ncbi:MAG: hypothetical protein V1909_00915 [Candidatus Micrarchaeota archaeon]
MGNCTTCGREVCDWEQSYYDGFQVCSDCYRRKFSGDGKNLLCTKCARRIGESEANRSLGTTLCSDCYKGEVIRRAEWVCALCKKNIRLDQKKFKNPDGKTLCEDCAAKGSAHLGMGTSRKDKCHRCKRKVAGEGFQLEEDKILCRDCAIKHMKGQDAEGIGDKLRHLFGNK